MRFRPRPGDPKPKTVFVLGGGGNLGAVQVGMLQALLERGITPDAVVGCSVGAINAAGLAGDPTLDGVARLEQIWLDLHGDTICPPGRLSSMKLLTKRGPGMTDGHGLRELLTDGLPFERLEDAQIPLHVVATNLTTGLEHWFSEGPAVPRIMASAALPAVLPPVEIDGDLFIDGAVVDNVPISRALELGATKVVVLHVGNFERARRMPSRPLDVLLQAFSIARNARFAHDASVRPPGVEVTVLPGIDPGRLRYNDFSRSRELMERAQLAAANFLDTACVAAAM